MVQRTGLWVFYLLVWFFFSVFQKRKKVYRISHTGWQLYLSFRMNPGIGAASAHSCKIW